MTTDTATTAVRPIARLAFSGDGSFSSTLAFTGWWFVPAVLARLVSIAANYYVFGGRTPPSGEQAVQNLLSQLQSDPVIIVSGLIGIALLLWSGVLWTYAMEHLHGISRRKAVICVGIPLVIALLLRISGLF